MQMKSTLRYLRGINMELTEQEKNDQAINQLYRVDFDAMDMDQLKAVSKLVMEARRRKGKARIGALQAGDRVMVTSGRKTNRGRVPKQMAGDVVEVKRTSVIVYCGQYGSWRVPGTMLEKI